MATIQRFEDVYSWRLGRTQASDVYTLTRRGPFRRDEAMVHQIRRAVLSITSNIAEGFERGTTRDFINYLYTAKGSAAEVRSQLQIASDQQYISATELPALLEKCEKFSQAIYSLIVYLGENARPKRQSSRSAATTPSDIRHPPPPFTQCPPQNPQPATFN